MHAQLLRALAIRKGIELLHKAQRMVGLLLHPGAQAGLQRAVVAGKGPAGKARPDPVVRIRGWPPVTATSTATRSACTECSSELFKPLKSFGDKVGKKDKFYGAADPVHGLSGLCPEKLRASHCASASGACTSGMFIDPVAMAT